MDSTTKLAVVELVIYLLVILLGSFILIKHGRRGIEAWIFYEIFCSLRIIAAGLQISNWNKIKDGKPASDTASIINSVGVSALLLCTCGVIREARTYTTNYDRKGTWIIFLMNHIAIATGIALAAIGGSNLFSAISQHDRNSGKTLLLAGYFIILAAMIGQIVFAFVTLRALRSPSAGRATPRVSGPASLVYAVLIAVTILFARIIYSIVFGFTLKPSLSPYTGSFAVKIVLIFLVQLLAAAVLGAAGLITRNLAKAVPVRRLEEANKRDTMQLR